MKRASGQALLELALCAPVLILLALGASAAVQVEDAGLGLDAATSAAASAAARAPDSAAADAAAHSRFAAVVASYPIHGGDLKVSFGAFSRIAVVTATSVGFVDVGWAGLMLPHRVDLHSRAVIRLERWRTHRTAG
jgi:Flp pilus assembly protein TadG